MIFSRTKLTTTFCVVFLSPMLIVGCHKIHSTTSPQSSQLQQLSEENSEFVKQKILAE